MSASPAVPAFGFVLIIVDIFDFSEFVLSVFVGFLEDFPFEYLFPLHLFLFQQHLLFQLALLLLLQLLNILLNQSQFTKFFSR